MEVGGYIILIFENTSKTNTLQPALTLNKKGLKIISTQENDPNIKVKESIKLLHN